MEISDASDRVAEAAVTTIEDEGRGVSMPSQSATSPSDMGSTSHLPNFHSCRSAGLNFFIFVLQSSSLVTLCARYSFQQFRHERIVQCP